MTRNYVLTIYIYRDETPEKKSTRVPLADVEKGHILALKGQNLSNVAIRKHLGRGEDTTRKFWAKYLSTGQTATLSRTETYDRNTETYHSPARRETDPTHVNMCPTIDIIKELSGPHHLSNNDDYMRVSCWKM